MLMIQISTEMDVIRLIYNELDQSEKTELQNTALLDEELKNDLDSLTVLKMKMNDLLFDPSEDSISNIMNYSRSYNK